MKCEEDCGPWGAGEMPMPVPDICCQYVSPNWMTLLRKIICRASMSVVAL